MTLNKSVYSDNFKKMLISLSNTFLYVKHNTPGHPKGGTTCSDPPTKVGPGPRPQNPCLEYYDNT